ncbi:hypothetical protein C922_05814 [Plasmodium inui San Antonio 1]|uniref:Uncharacterized protein n=1 Tax=Plasmodium inui San Antonio 1 TaxID=1237626 RepID=W6ZX03_9APIC|nr:hypothetical protein C922_05814 [Plasmodium inui San Antonio 1]EUD63805.1 hypothetical protein C922_05814 [Plasmodium inui San Antonio 1]
MASLHDFFVRHLEELSRGSASPGDEGRTLRILKPRQGVEEGQELNGSKRWENVGGEGYVRHVHAPAAAAIICRNLGAWMSNLIRDGGQQGTWEQGQCTADKLGAFAGSRDTRACDYGDVEKQWKPFKWDQQFDSKKAEQRSFVNCIDIFVIFLTVMMNIGAQGEEWIDVKTKKSPCATLYDWYEKWGGPEVAEELMKLMTSNSAKIGIGRGNYVKLGDSSDKFWSRIQKGFRTRAYALQCPGEGNNRYSQTPSCVVMPDDQTSCQSGPPNSIKQQVRNRLQTIRTRLLSSPRKKEFADQRFCETGRNGEGRRETQHTTGQRGEEAGGGRRPMETSRREKTGRSHGATRTERENRTVPREVKGAEINPTAKRRRKIGG